MAPSPPTPLPQSSGRGELMEQSLLSIPTPLLFLSMALLFSPFFCARLTLQFLHTKVPVFMPSNAPGRPPFARSVLCASSYPLDRAVRRAYPTPARAESF